MIKIAVLAASKYQVPFIKEAKKMGLYVLTIDNVPSNPGHVLADTSYNISTLYKESILHICEKESISGIISPCTDIALPAVSYVTEKLNLNNGTPSNYCIEILCSKWNFREFLKKENIKFPQYFEKKDFNKLNFEKNLYITKPDKSSGSKGVFIVSNLEELACKEEEVMHHSVNNKYHLEEYIEGTQYTIEGVVEDFEIKHHFILERLTIDKPYVATRGHRTPSKISQIILAELLNILNKIFRKLFYKSGPFDCDFAVKKDDIYLFEIAPRAGGNSISNLLELAYKFDMPKYVIKNALNSSFHYNEFIPNKVFSIIILGVDRKGFLDYNQLAFDKVKSFEWVHKVDFDFPIGTKIFPFINGKHRIGEVILSGEDNIDLIEKEQKILGLLEIKASQNDIF